MTCCVALDSLCPSQGLSASGSEQARGALGQMEKRLVSPCLPYGQPRGGRGPVGPNIALPCLLGQGLCDCFTVWMPPYDVEPGSSRG